MSEDPKDPDPIEFEAELRRYGRAEPFTPFVIIFSSGDRVQVLKSDYLAFNPNSLAVYGPREGFQLYRKNQIVGFQLLEQH